MEQPSGWVTMNIFSDNVNSGDVLRAETYQNLLNFVKGSSVAGGTVSAGGIHVPSEYIRSPRIVRFFAEENIKNYSIIELTEQMEEGSDGDNVVPTFKARPANGDAGTLFYTGSSLTDAGCFGMAYSIGGEPILIRSTAETNGTPQEGEIVEAADGAFRYLGKSVSPDLKWFLPVQGGGVATPPTPRVRLVQGKELFPACEYKTLQDVYGCTLEYSQESAWIVAATFDIVGGRVVHTFSNLPATPHQYWRINLRGFAYPENPNDPNADRGFFTFGRLWGVRFETAGGKWVDGSLQTATPPTLLPSAVCKLPSAGPWDSQPVPRKSQNHRLWTLTFDQPEVAKNVTLEVDQHFEHYIVCPGGRDANGNVISFIYSFDLVTEKWTATTFPALREPMFNMDAKVIKLPDQTHSLVVLSGQTTQGHFSGTIQGYNFEKNYVQDSGGSQFSFAGRPAIVGDVQRGWESLPSTFNHSNSLLVLGGAPRSTAVYGREPNMTFAVSLHNVLPATLSTEEAYRWYRNGIPFVGVQYTGLPFGAYNVTTWLSSAGAVGELMQTMMRYTRHQNLPVRGILRRRPEGMNDIFPTLFSNHPKIVDFLLIGGFNSVGNAEYNRSVVSGMFGSMSNQFIFSMLVENVHLLATNRNHFLIYPDSPYVLGDCCAEYIEERDEIITFGGRANETDTANAHDQLATLVFNPDDDTASWNTEKYPRQPNPRWSAASVLIRDLQRKGETEPCDRIFIIGGRNRDGFVPEVDVFNLRHNRWETDWLGLDDGELETIPASMGGGGGVTINIQNIQKNIQGGDCVQEVLAGTNVTITGDKKIPVVNAVLTWG